MNIKPFYTENIQSLVEQNNSYRKVIFTGNNQQLVLMSIGPNDSIPMEIHEEHDQFIRIESGEGIGIVGGTEYILKDDSAIIIPAGMPHQIINTNSTEQLKLYTIYSPPEHPKNLIQHSNPNLNKINYKSKYIKYKFKYYKSKQKNSI